MPLTICMALVQRRLPGNCTAQVFGCAGAALSCSVIVWFPSWQRPATLMQIRIGGISVRPCDAYATDADAVGDRRKRKARTRNAKALAVPAFPRPPFALSCGAGVCLRARA